MSESADIASRTQRFNDAVRAFTPASPPRHAKLMPLKEGIVELRQKGASIRLIRELLATVGVAVGTYTIARFLNEMNGEPEPRSRNKRARFTRRSEPKPILVQRPTEPLAQTSAPDRTRTRGPRVADPRNL